ncbi:nucleotide-binding universal stress UspA family protein [Catenulispora sp. GP43]|uniref:universal stress protein n=1 Tax=Catenulispora sp. GP43 TaxID=3156263 RepID=UPI003511540D
MKHTVVVGYDQSPSGERALGQAGREAAWRNGSVTVVNAFQAVLTSPIGYFPTDVETSLKEAADEIAAAGVAGVRQRYPGMTVDSAVVAGPAADALAEASRDADLLVLGNRGRGGFAGLLLGSVSMRTLTLASCPTMIVRGAQRDPVHTVLLAVDVADPAEESMDFAFADASMRRAQLKAVTVWDLDWIGADDPDTADSLVKAERNARADIRSTLERQLRPWHAEHPEVHVVAEVLGGTPSAALTDLTGSTDLIVAGAHRRGDDHLGMRPGPTAHTLLHHADCPVVVVPRA